MIRLILYIIVLGAASLLGIQLKPNASNVMLAYNNWSLELPLWLAIVLGFLALFLLLLLYKFIASIFNSYSKFKQYIKNRKIKNARKSTNDAFLQLAEAEWHKAERNAIKGAAYSDTPFVNYVSAAKAAQEQGAWERRDKYLELAAENIPGAGVATKLMKAQLQLQCGQDIQGRATLLELKDTSPKHPLVHRLLAEVYEREGKWHDLYKLLPDLRRTRALSHDKFFALEGKAYEAMLIDVAKCNGQKELVHFWDSIPKLQKNETLIVKAYVSCLHKVGAGNEAEQVLRAAIKKHWDSELIKMYGFVNGADLGKQIAFAESLLKSHPDDTVLLLTLARLCLRFQLWGKARNYLEASIRIHASPEAYAELGRLLGHLGESEKCQDCYKKGLGLLVEGE